MLSKNTFSDVLLFVVLAFGLSTLNAEEEDKCAYSQFICPDKHICNSHLHDTSGWGICDGSAYCDETCNCSQYMTYWDALPGHNVTFHCVDNTCERDPDPDCTCSSQDLDNRYLGHLNGTNCFENTSIGCKYNTDEVYQEFACILGQWNQIGYVCHQCSSSYGPDQNDSCHDDPNWGDTYDCIDHMCQPNNECTCAPDAINSDWHTLPLNFDEGECGDRRTVTCTYGGGINNQGTQEVLCHNNYWQAQNESCCACSSDSHCGSGFGCSGCWCHALTPPCDPTVGGPCDIQLLEMK